MKKCYRETSLFGAHSAIESIVIVKGGGFPLASATPPHTQRGHPATPLMLAKNILLYLKYDGTL